MIGPEAVLVTPISATHGGYWEMGPEHMCAVDRTHSEIVKFGAHDPEYDEVCVRIRGLVRRAVDRRA
jgi:protein SERAC1